MSLTTEQLSDLPVIAATAICDERTRRPWASDAELIEAVALRVGAAIGDYIVTEEECEYATEDAREEGKTAGKEEAREDLAAIIAAGFAREDSDRDILRALCAELGIDYKEATT